MRKQFTMYRQEALLESPQPTIKYRELASDRHGIEATARVNAQAHIGSLEADAPDMEDFIDIKARAYLIVAKMNTWMPAGEVLTDDFCRYEAIFVEAYLQASREAYSRRRQAKHEQRKLVAER